jgi:membrane-associated phospholipid phosphatase
MTFTRWLSLACILLGVTPAAAGTADSKIENAGTIVALAMPVAAGGISLLHDRDWEGLGEFTESTALTVGTALVLKQIVKERRPDHSDFQSFPSDTAALAYSSADYLWDRYGWEYGVPAYAAAMFVGYSRVKAKKHHWYDVLASSAIAFGFNYAFVTRYHQSDRFSVYASATPDEVGLHLAMNW